MKYSLIKTLPMTHFRRKLNILFERVLAYKRINNVFDVQNRCGAWESFLLPSGECECVWLTLMIRFAKWHVSIHKETLGKQRINCLWFRETDHSSGPRQTLIRSNEIASVQDSLWLAVVISFHQFSNRNPTVRYQQKPNEWMTRSVHHTHRNFNSNIQIPFQFQWSVSV